MHCVVTSTGGLEEDIIKTYGDFLHGDFDADGGKLREAGGIEQETFLFQTKDIFGLKILWRSTKKVYADNKK